jgi:hypothetical protein
LARESTGKSSAAKIAIIAMTTSSSIKVNPRQLLILMDISAIPHIADRALADNPNLSRDSDNFSTINNNHNRKKRIHEQ